MRPLLLAVLLAGCGGGPTATPEVMTRPAAPLFAVEPPLTGERYRTMRLWPEYEGEEKAGGHFETAVKYLGAEQRERYRVVVRDGRLHFTDGRVLNAGKKFPGKWGGEEAESYAIYVMDAAGNLYFSFEHERGIFHHSSFLAGGPVSMAGDAHIFDGQLVQITNQSGHYRPPPAAFPQVVERLEEMGLDMKQVKVEIFGADLAL